MRETGDHTIELWKVDYGDGSNVEDVTVPHAWRQDLPLDYEGPVVYKTSIEVPKAPSKLRFRGVSYEAEIELDGKPVARHRGLWDAFEIPLDAFPGARVEVSVSVVKNGGSTYPVHRVASGYLPYLYHTFGGIFGEVSIVDGDDPLSEPPPALSRYSVRGSQLWVDDAPFYVRGIQHSGWYPELGHTNVSLEIVRREVRAIKQLGFNLVKFGMWVPPHRYLDAMREVGLEAWLELPIYRPCSDTECLSQMAHEAEQIVRQYRRHDNIMFWSVPSFEGGRACSELQTELEALVQNLTSSPLVRTTIDNQRASPHQLADYYDFRVACEPQFCSALLDTLLPGPRLIRPLVLGKCSDADVHRDLAGLAAEIPYWGSNLSELNEQGVRTRYGLPEVLRANRFARDPVREHHRRIMESSRQMALFVHKSAHECARARSEISGTVASDIRDTPIGSSGFFDDWDVPRFESAEIASWNGPACLFLIPKRLPQQRAGGMRAGYGNPLNRFCGEIRWSVGLHSEAQIRGGLVWRVLDSERRIVANGAERFLAVEPLISTEIGMIRWDCGKPGSYQLEVEFGPTINAWPIWVCDPLNESALSRWSTDDPLGLLEYQSSEGDLLLTTRATLNLRPGLVALTGEGTVAKPFWRGAAYEFLNDSFWLGVPFDEQWGRLLPISPDRVLDTGWLESLNTPYETLLNRIDVKSYAEDPVLVRAGKTFITTLRPFGGLGDQPFGLPSNPAGLTFLGGVADAL